MDELPRIVTVPAQITTLYALRTLGCPGLRSKSYHTQELSQYTRSPRALIVVVDPQGRYPAVLLLGPAEPLAPSTGATMF